MSTTFKLTADQLIISKKVETIHELKFTEVLDYERQFNKVFNEYFVKELPHVLIKARSEQGQEMDLKRYTDIILNLPQDSYPDFFKSFYDPNTRDDNIFLNIKDKKGLSDLKRLLFEWSNFKFDRNEGFWVFPVKDFIEQMEKFINTLDKSFLTRLFEEHIQILFLIEAFHYHQLESITLEKKTSRTIPKPTKDGRIDILIKTKPASSRPKEKYYILELKHVRENETNQIDCLLKKAIEQCRDSSGFLDNSEQETLMTQRWAFVSANKGKSKLNTYKDVTGAIKACNTKMDDIKEENPDMVKYLEILQILSQLKELKDKESISETKNALENVIRSIEESKEGMNASIKDSYKAFKEVEDLKMTWELIK